MKIPHKKRNLFLPVMFIIAILLSALCFVSHESSASTHFSNALSFVTTPLRSATKSTYDFFSSMGVYFSDIDDLKNQNKALIKENKSLREENKSLSELQKENDSLYKFLELKKERTDYKLTNANIISVSSSGYSAYFTIDKGSFHGIKENMPIISDDGVLLGLTYSVDSSSSRCKSILCYDLSVGIYDKETGETGILSGSFDSFTDGNCEISNLSDTTTMSEGHTILTSGLGEIYPRGLIIGSISSFRRDKTSHTQNAVVTPAATTHSSDGIMVITSFERVYE